MGHHMRGGGSSWDSQEGSSSGVSMQGSSILSINGVWGQGDAIAHSIAVPEGSSQPLSLGSAVAILSAALSSSRAASRPLESLSWLSEGGSRAATLTITISKET